MKKILCKLFGHKFWGFDKNQDDRPWIEFITCSDCGDINKRPTTERPIVREKMNKIRK